MENNQLKPNSKVRIEWKGFYHEMSKSKENDIKETFSRKYNIPKSQIELDKIYLKKSESTERISNAILESLLNPEKLEKAYQEFLFEKHPDADFTEFLKIDKEVSSKLITAEDTHDFRERKYKFLWIKSKNIFSYQDFYRDYTDKTGVVSIYSNPGNQGGKTALSRMPSFLLFGNKIKYGRKTSITFADVFNTYTDDSEAFIEGEIQIQNDVYFLRRTLKKSKKGTLSHSFNIYKYDESGEYYDFLGKNAIDLSIKEAQKTRKVFEATIGSYEDYVFSSYYESQNIEKWLETTEKERYRLFCEYLGLGILEEKYQAALELMKNHVKASFISKYSIEGLQGEIQDAKVEISDIVGGINEREAHVKRLNGKIQEFQEKVNLLSKEIKVVDSRIKGLTLESLESKLSKFISERQAFINESAKLRNQYDDLIKETSSFQEKAVYESNIQSLMQDTDIDSKIPSDLKKLLIDLKNKQFEVKETQQEIERRNEASDEYQDLQVQYKTVSELLKTLAEDIVNVPEGYACTKCGHIESRECAIVEIKEKININKIKLEEIKNLGIKAKKNLEDISKEIQDELQKKKSQISAEVRAVEVQISDFRSVYQKEINQKILDNQNFVDKLKEVDNLQGKIESSLKDFELVQIRIKEVEVLINLFKDSKEIFEHNTEVEKQICVERELILMKQKEISEENQNIQKWNSEKAVLEYKISSNLQMISEMEKDYKKEKNIRTYLNVHGDEGLSKHIILTILPQINADLAEVLNGITDFELQIDFDDKGIRFFYFRDGKSFNLYQGSGFEKATSCLALHYVNIRMTTLPISNNLVLDEVFGGFSRENMESIKKLLNKLGEVFDTIDVITHTLNSEVKHVADHTILIQKTNNFSKIVK